jgi:hypothetical protein
MRHPTKPYLACIFAGGEWPNRHVMTPAETGIIDPRKHHVTGMRMPEPTRPETRTVTGGGPRARAPTPPATPRADRSPWPQWRQSR